MIETIFSSSDSDTWILNSLVEYYYITSSKEAIDILINVKTPHDKVGDAAMSNPTF